MFYKTHFKVSLKVPVNSQMQFCHIHNTLAPLFIQILVTIIVILIIPGETEA